MRLFVALDIDELIRQRITKFVHQLKAEVPEVRFVGPESYHITLKFIGETQKFEAIRETLRSVESRPFELRLGGVGFFPNTRAPRVFWSGIDAGEELEQLSDAVNRSLEPLGFAAETGPFHPHLTLARSGSGNPRARHGGTNLQRVSTIVSTIDPPEFGTMTAHEFYLYESKLSPQGAQYTRRECYLIA